MLRRAASTTAVWLPWPCCRHSLCVVCVFLRGRCRRRHALYWSGHPLSFLHVGSEREQVTSSFTESRPVSLILRFSACRFGILEKLGLPKLVISPGEFDGLSPLQWPFYLAKVWSVATKHISEVLGVHERLLNKMGNGRKRSSNDPVWASVCVCVCAHVCMCALAHVHVCERVCACACLCVQWFTVIKKIYHK